MTRDLLLFYGSQVPETEEEDRALMAAWRVWFDSLGPDADPGNAVIDVRAVGRDSEAAEDPVTGYSLLSADSMEAAADAARRCPVVGGGGRVEVCETYPVN